jgi:hypothetical protein
MAPPDELTIVRIEKIASGLQNVRVHQMPAQNAAVSVRVTSLAMVVESKFVQARRRLERLGTSRPLGKTRASYCQHEKEGRQRPREQLYKVDAKAAGAA